MKIARYIIFLFFIQSLFGSAQSIVNTKHNLSLSGRENIKASSESEVCLFCHTPHTGSPLTPMWNRASRGTNYVLYNSSTMKALPGQPSGSSMLCLSCHDGTIALGEVLSKTSRISFANTVNMPLGPSNLSTDLSNDHPISFAYDVALSIANGKIKNPALLPSQLKLEDGQLQCTSCHDPHKSTYGDFLVLSTQNSKLCVACHQEPNWTSSSHNTSSKTWNKVEPNPWPYTAWNNVAQNACENCHNPHNAGSSTRLLKYQAEESNCLDCHNANAASKNIQIELTKAYKHNVYAYTGIHDPTEQALVNSKHVECTDCHNAHQTNADQAKAPAVKGANKGVLGINQKGVAVNPALYEYEICYRCHSGNAAGGVTSPRVIVQSDLRLAFDPTNPSFHPIAAVGRNTSIEGLISPYSPTSQMYCTDCHSSNGTGAAGGPHGSIYPQILKYNYDRSSNYVDSYAAYELCYQCHDQTQTISKHNLLSESGTHGRITSCNTCHDPHGISSTQGNARNNSYLINFNMNVVSKNSIGSINWIYSAPDKGTCNLSCHDHNHVNSRY